MSEPQTQQRFCGCCENTLKLLGRRRQPVKWDRTQLRWFVADWLPGVSALAQTAAYAQAFGAWQAVCGLTFEQTNNHTLADFIIQTRPIDGKNGTLAEHQLPYGSDETLRGWFDLGEGWSVESQPEGDKIDLITVATHEFGHGIGIGHLDTPGSLMNPFYNPEIRTPQLADIAEGVRRYGGALAPPDPDPVPIPGSDAPFQVTIETVAGEIYGPVLVSKAKT